MNECLHVVRDRDTAAFGRFVHGCSRLRCHSTLKQNCRGTFATSRARTDCAHVTILAQCMHSRCRASGVSAGILVQGPRPFSVPRVDAHYSPGSSAPRGPPKLVVDRCLRLGRVGHLRCGRRIPRPSRVTRARGNAPAPAQLRSPTFDYRAVETPEPNNRRTGRHESANPPAPPNANQGPTPRYAGDTPP